jgi:D-alanyl-D-alanine carboxypeptidase
MNLAIIFIIIAFLSAFVIVFAVVSAMAKQARPLTVQEGREALRLYAGRLRSKPQLAGAGLSVLHPISGLREAFGADADPERRMFHAASVGKLFTATLIARLIEEGRLAWDSRVAELLPPEELRGLFEWHGADRSGDVTVAMLLSHTSGVADYFDDTGRSRKSVSALLAEEPHRLWSVEQLLDFSRNEQRPVGPPGARFHYSDTGYLLLGRIIEVLRGLPFHIALKQGIFEPAGMRDAYMLLREPAPLGTPPLRPAYLRGVDLAGSNALSADWSGGGVALSAADLLAFCEALNSGRLLRPETLERMADFRWRFRQGVGYGYGIMELRFGEFFPLLKSWPRMRGHMGVLGIQCFWDPSDGTVIIVSLSNDRAMAESVKLLITALGILRRIKT